MGEINLVDQYPRSNKTKRKEQLVSNFPQRKQWISNE